MSEDEGPLRAFVALELSEGLRGRILELQSELSKRAPGVRWIARGAVHLTLRFLGQASPKQLALMGEALKTASAACPATKALVTGVGTFPERGHPRVLWLGLRVAPEVMALQVACESAAVKAGFAPENRAFLPHLTLGRWRDRAPRPTLPGVDLGSTVLDTLTLFRSDLGRGGAIYTPLQRFTLAAGEA